MMEYELSVAFILSKPGMLNRASYILWVLLVSGKIHEKRKKNRDRVIPTAVSLFNLHMECGVVKQICILHQAHLLLNTICLCDVLFDDIQQ